MNRRFSPRFAAFVTIAAAALSHAAAAAPPADFTLKDTHGGAFRLSEARGKFVALHFLLKTECPYCIQYTREYVEQAVRVPGVVHVFIKPDTVKEIEQWEQRAAADELKFSVYRDANAKLAKSLGVPDGYRFHGQSVHFPALILLDGAGKEVFRYVGKSNADRCPFDTFAAKVAELSRDPAVKEFNLKPGEPAIGGHDPVSYQTGRPAMGSSGLAADYRGVTYWFVDAKNRAAFAADPEKFVPQYGGWCATAMADGGRKVEIDPASYKVTNGRLFLFYKGWLGDALKEWNKDEAGQTVRADAEWKKLAPTSGR